MVTLTPKLGLKKPTVNVETDWGSRLNETIDSLDDAVLTANTTGKGTVTVTDDGAGNLTISGSATAGSFSPNALVGADGITVTSGTSEDTITGFRTEFVAASGSLQTQIDAVEGSDVDSVNSATGDITIVGVGEVNVTTDGTTITVSGSDHTAGGGGTVSDAIIGGVGITVTSGISETTIDGHLRYTSAENDAIIGVGEVVVTSGTGVVVVSGTPHTENTDTVSDAIIGVDGITVISGTNVTTVSGFRNEFVNASGTLQTAIDAVEGSDVDSVNAVIGAVLVTGTNGVNTVTVGQTITVSAVASEIDHGSIGGLGDDDHPQYGQLADAESASGVWDFSTNLTVTGSNVRTAGDLDNTSSGTSGLSLIGWPTLTAADVGTALETLSSVLSAGHTSGGVITSGTSDNTIDISAGGGCIRKDNATTSPVLRFGWPVLTGLALSTTAINYVGIEFNSGNPQAVTRTTYDWNFRNEFPLGNVVSVSGVLHIENASQDVADAPGQILERFFRTHPKDRDDFAGGLILSESADNNRNMAVSAGALWDRLTRFVISAVDTSASDTFDAFYFDGGTFQTEFGRTTWPNTQFNDITSGLVTMTNNRHAVLWFYLKVDGDLDMVYGTAQYTSEGAAEGEGEPSVPNVIAAQGTLIGRLIFQKNDTIAELVETSFERSFAGSLATDHGNLSGLADDDHTQYSLVDGTRAFTGAIAGITPIIDADLTTKLYVDNADTTISGHLSTEIDTDISTHAADTDAHHAKYTDAEAITALVPTTNALVASGVADEANLVTISGHLQGSIDAVEGSDVDSLNALTGTIVVVGKGEVGVTVEGQNIVVSGTDHVAGGGGGGTVSDAIIGGVGITVTSGSNITTIDGHPRYTSAENDAILGSDGIIITSGTNEITVGGFRTEFVNASGSLQTQIDGKLSNVVEDTTPTLGGTLDANSNDIDNVGTLTATTVTGTSIQSGGAVTAQTGDFSTSLTLSGLPVLIHSRDFVLGSIQDPDINLFDNLPDLSEAIGRVAGPTRVHVDGSVTVNGSADFSEVSLFTLNTEEVTNRIVLETSSSVNRIPLRSQGVGFAALGSFANWLIDVDNLSPICISDAEIIGFVGDVFLIENGVEATFNLRNVTATSAVGSAFNLTTSGSVLRLNLINSELGGETLEGPVGTTIVIRKDASSVISSTAFLFFSGTQSITNIDDSEFVVYDNSTSGLNSTTTQDAIDEVAGLTGAVETQAFVTFSGTDTRQSTSVFANADDGTAVLQFAVGTSEIWRFTCLVLASVSSIAPDIKFQFTGPAGVSGFSAGATRLLTGDTGGVNSLSTSMGRTSLASATDQTIIIEGVVLTNHQDTGNVTLQWAQNNSNSNTVTMEAGSFIHAQQVI